MRFHRLVDGGAGQWVECRGCASPEWEHAEFQPVPPPEPQPPTQLEAIDRELYGEKGHP